MRVWETQRPGHFSYHLCHLGAIPGPLLPPQTAPQASALYLPSAWRGMMCAFLAPFLLPAPIILDSQHGVLLLPFLRTPMQPCLRHQKPERARPGLGRAQAVLPTSSVEPGGLSHHVHVA